MHIFEIYKIENASVLCNFQIKERELFLFSNTCRTDKWLSLENWSYIYKKLSGIAKNYIDNHKHETSISYVPGDLKLTIKFQVINGDIKKLLDINNYKYDYYINILIDYVSNARAGSKRIEGKREKYREYSPSLVSHNESDNHYTPKPTTNNKPNTNEASTYKPAPFDGGKNSGKDEYIPESGAKDSDSPDISYKPTKIEELSQTSSDGTTGPNSSKRRRKYESLNEEFLGSQNRNKTIKSPTDDTLTTTEHNKRKQKGKEKKKSKLTGLFSQSDSDSNEVIPATPTDSTRKKELMKKHMSTSDSKHNKPSSSVKHTKLPDDKLSSKFGGYTGLDAPLPKNKFNCHKLTISEIKESFKVVQPKLDKCINSYYDEKRRLKLYCEDPLIIHELFTEAQATFMYQQLQDRYLSENDTGANFADLFTQVLLPAWALHLSAKVHKIPEEIISKLNVKAVSI